MNPTLLDYAILGLIQNEPLSGYGIRKVFEETALGNYSSSPGTIYPALKRLLKLELIEKITQVSTRKSRFQITKKGVQVLQKWLSKPLTKIEVEKNTAELFLRFAFMDTLLTKKQIISFLTSFHSLLNKYIGELQVFHKKEAATMSIHGKLAFEYGIDSNKTMLKWCKKAIQQLT